MPDTNSYPRSSSRLSLTSSCREALSVAPAAYLLHPFARRRLFKADILPPAISPAKDHDATVQRPSSRRHRGEMLLTAGGGAGERFVREKNIILLLAAYMLRHNGNANDCVMAVRVFLLIMTSF
jgi:hypothetical protein